MRKIIFASVIILNSIVSLPLMLIFWILKDNAGFYKVFIKPSFKFLLFCLNVKINIEGELPEDLENTLIISNHTSMIDVLVLVSIVKPRLQFVSKYENKWVPIIGWWMVMNDTVFIKRDNLKQSIKEMTKVTKGLKENRTFMIFPQGTRNVREINFKPGSLKFVQKAKGNILPLSIKGPNEVLKGFSLKKKEINIKVFDIIQYEDYENENLVILQNEIENKIKENFFNE